MAASIILAFLAAVSNAASNVLQRKANREEQEDQNFSVRVLWDLLHQKIWLAGMITVTASFMLQATALGYGALAVVQPIIVLELPLTLIAAWRFLGAPMPRRAIIAGVTLTVGVIGLLLSLQPHSASHPNPGTVTWLAGLLASYGTVGVLMAIGLRYQGLRRAAFYGAATGVTFGVTAALMKQMTLAFRHGGIPGAFTSWSTYLMIATGVLGMLLLQNAFQAGPIVAAQPGITLLDPLTAVVWGVVAFGEHVNTGALLVPAVLSVAALGLAAVELARTHGIDPENEDPPRRRTDDRAREDPSGRSSVRSAAAQRS